MSTLLKSLIFISVLFGQFAFAQVGSCREATETTVDLVANQKLRFEAQEAQRRIEDLDKKIKDLRLKNGIWETQDITDKRMNILNFESLILMDDQKSVQAHFAGAISATERAAIRFLISEEIVKFYRAQIESGQKSNEELAGLIDDELKNLEQAKKEFLEISEQTASLSYVIKAMMSEGAVVDVTTLFSSASRTLDIHGKEIKLKPEVALESVMLHSEQEISSEEVMARAQTAYKQFGSYYNSEPVQNHIKAAQALLGNNFRMPRPDYWRLKNLRDRLKPDWNTTSDTIARRTATLKQERILRWKLRLLGPQLSEMIKTWIGAADGKYRKSLEPLARLAGLEYDSAVRERHLAKILKILSLNDPETQLNQLLDGSTQNAYAAKGELIVTFIRFTRSRDDWNKIKAVLKVDESSYDKKLAEQFEKYEDEAIARGPLGLYVPTADPVGAVIASGIGAGGVALTGTAGSYLVDKIYSTETVQGLLHLVQQLAN